MMGVVRRLADMRGPGGADACRRALSACGAAVLAVGALTVSGIGCVFRFATGVPCPGCGMTRAYLAFLSGDVACALAFHPLFWMVPIAGLLAAAQGALSSMLVATGGARCARYALLRAAWRACVALLALIACTFLAVWLVRLADPCDAGLLFSGVPPSGAEADVVFLSSPRWLG